LTVSTVAIVDDHELIAEALRVALSQSGVDAHCVPPAELDEVLAELLGRHPDLVLLDLNLGDFGETTRIIEALARAGIRVLLLTGVVGRVEIAAALEQGAVGYVRKSDGFPALLAKARAALDGEDVLDAAERLRMLDELRVARARQAALLAPFQQLTEREQDLLRALAQGRTVTEVARAWVVSEATVRSHVRGVLTKLDVGSQLGAVALAIDAGWLER
jgi:DNA-binding NarL/FixJ family response regulator